MSRFAVEQVGSTVALLARRLEHLDRDPASFPELVDLDRGVRAMTGQSAAALLSDGPDDSDTVKRLVQLVAWEHRPAREPWACKRDSQEIVYRYPHPFTVMAEAKQAATATQAADLIEEADSIRILQRLTREMNRSHRPRRPHATRAKFGGRCSRCPQDIGPGMAVYVVGGAIWHHEHGCEEALAVA